MLEDIFIYFLCKFACALPADQTLGRPARRPQQNRQPAAGCVLCQVHQHAHLAAGLAVALAQARLDRLAGRGDQEAAHHA